MIKLVMSSIIEKSNLMLCWWEYRLVDKIYQKNKTKTTHLRFKQYI